MYEVAVMKNCMEEGDEKGFLQAYKMLITSYTAGSVMGGFSTYAEDLFKKIARHPVYAPKTALLYVSLCKDFFDPLYPKTLTFSTRICALYSFMGISSYPHLVEELRVMTATVRVTQRLSNLPNIDQLLPEEICQTPRDPYIIKQIRVIKKYAHAKHISVEEAALIWTTSYLASQYRLFVNGEYPHALQPSHQSHLSGPEEQPEPADIFKG